MQQIGDLLKRIQKPGMGGAISRAMVLAEANRWIAARSDLLARHVRARAIIGGNVTVQCTAGAAASEVRLLAPALLAHLRTTMPGYTLRSLNCFVKSGSLTDDTDLTDEGV